jgi:acetyl esterase
MSGADTLAEKPALDPAIADIAKRWATADIPDLYAGCLDSPHGGEVCRERGRNVRGMFYPKPILPTGNIEKLNIAGVHGDIHIRIVWPHASFVADLPSGKPQSTLVYFHGGGWIVGDVDSHEAHAIRLANEAQCVVVNVDYRLAPEHRFPCAYDDCLSATLWARNNIARLGGHASKLAVGGDSAGGNLAAAVAIACRDQSIPLAAQLLIYPATDLTKLKGTPEQAYLGIENDHLRTDWRASPAHAHLPEGHIGLAPAIIGVGVYDFLFKDNVAYAALLRATNVPLVYREYPTLNHGFFSYTAISNDSLIAAQQLCADLKTAFESCS